MAICYLVIMKLSVFSKGTRKKTQTPPGDVNDFQKESNKLEEDRKTLALIQDAEHYSIFEYNFTTKMLTSSLDLFNSLGYVKQEIPKTLPKLSKLIHPEDLPKIKENVINQCINKKSIYRFECRIMSKSKSWSWIGGSMQITEWETDNQPVSIKCITRIIDEKKESLIKLKQNSIKIKQELKAKDEHLNDLVRLLPEVIFETDAQGILQFTNEKAYEIFGYTHSDFRKGINIFKCLAPEDRKRANKNFKDALHYENSKSQGNEYTAMTKKGDRFPILIYSTPVYKNKILSGLRGIIVTISELKKSQEELRKSEENFRQLAENITDAFWLVDLNNQLLYFNKSCETLIETQLKGPFDFPDIFFNYIHPDDKQKIHIKINKAQNDPDLRQHYEHRIITKSGIIKWISVRTFPVFNNEGKPYRKAGIATDTTQEKSLVQELVSAKEQAEKADKLKSAFLANMSHEIRTPMNGVLGFAELLKDPQSTPSEKMEYINIIQDNGKYLLTLINDIIDFAKIEAGELTITKKAFDLNLFFTNLYKTYKNHYKSRLKAIEFTYHIKPEKPTETLISDAFRIEQILINLISNAFKFTTYGKIEIGFKLNHKINNKKYIKFYVSDTGIGISKEDQQRIFTTFGQIESSNQLNPKGTGLGLAISKNLAELLGGYIGVNSKPGKGSTFYFFIPLETECEEKIKISTKKLTSKNVNLNNKTILVVEDDEVNMEYLKKLLQKKNINVLSSTTGEKAVETVKKLHSTIDLVLMDIKLPGIDGYETTLQIKAIDNTIPIIAQTAHAMEEYREKSIAIGCIDHINKPIQKNVLFEKLNNYLYINKKE